MGPRFKNKRTRFIRIPVENPFADQPTLSGSPSRNKIIYVDIYVPLYGSFVVLRSHKHWRKTVVISFWSTRSKSTPFQSARVCKYILGKFRENVLVVPFTEHEMIHDYLEVPTRRETRGGRRKCMKSLGLRVKLRGRSLTLRRIYI